MAIKNEQSREAGNIGYTRLSKSKQKTKHSMCCGHYYTQTNTNNVNKTWALSQTIEGKAEPNMIFH